jgi:hypothetical protein
MELSDGLGEDEDYVSLPSEPGSLKKISSKSELDGRVAVVRGMKRNLEG